MCDDVTVETAGDGVRLQPDCGLGAGWFSERMGAPEGPPATIDGEAADVESAVARAAELLRGARRPLIHGFDGATVEDARAAVTLADQLGALITTGDLEGRWPGAPAVPLRGASTATLGEIRDRSRLVVIWREDPEATHPRLLDRLGFGVTLSRLGAERTLVVVEDRDTATLRRADVQLHWGRERDLEALTSLHMLRRGLAPRPDDLAPELSGLIERLSAVPHATFVYGQGLTAGAGGQRRALALHELVRALCHGRHVVTLELPRSPGTRSADDVLAWQTGYAGGVDLAPGHPELVTATRPLAARDGVDVSLRVESAPAIADLGSDRDRPLLAAVGAGCRGVDPHRGRGRVRRRHRPPARRRPAFAPGAADRRCTHGRGAARPAARRGAAVTAIRITGGAVHDPANDVDGEIRDVCLNDGKVVADVGPDARRIDARGMVVMPGGVDIHAHIAGPKVNAARRLSPEDRAGDPIDRTGVLRSGSGGLVPSTFATGYRYSLLGYTTVVEAAAPPLAARHVLSELRDTPMIDKAFLILMGNNQVLFELIRESGPGGPGPHPPRAASSRLRDAVAWWLDATGGYGVKLVNPGGVELYKQSGGQIDSLDDEVAGFGVTPRQVLEAIGGAVDELGLPHPVHIHANNLGVPGNADTTLDTMRTLSGREAHFAHLQFHCYGASPTQRGGLPRSRAPELLEHLSSHPEITVDVGQVMFGPAMTMTADAHVSEVLRDLDGGKWLSHDTEVETGCGIVPYTYRAGNYVHALQWGIGLELFLLGKDPWQVMLSTDHPNGGSFLSYPKLIRLLMDHAFREDQMRGANQKAIRRTALLDGLDREYTLNEIAIITRAAPARRLGLRDKGHLGIGADADVTIYHDRSDREEMFATPRYVIKAGELAVEDGDLRLAADGMLLSSRAPFDPDVAGVLAPLFGDRYTVAFDHYPVRDPALREPARIIEAGRE